MPESERQRRAQAARAAAREATGVAYEQLARREAERVELLEAALQAAAQRLRAAEHLRVAEDAVVAAVTRLIGVGMRLTDVATVVEIELAELQRMLGEHKE